MGLNISSKLQPETKYKSNKGSLMALLILSAPKENNNQIVVDKNPISLTFGYNSNIIVLKYGCEVLYVQ